MAMRARLRHYLGKYCHCLNERLGVEARIFHYVVVIVTWVWIDTFPQLWPPWHPLLWVSGLALPMAVIHERFFPPQATPGFLLALTWGFMRIYAFFAWHNVASVLWLYSWTHFKFFFFFLWQWIWPF